MIIRLMNDSVLRGHGFEYIAKTLLRRQNKNNFIFLCSQFDSVDDIISKYRLDCNSIPQIQQVAAYLRVNGWKTDIIEFVLEDVALRKVVAINFYDVKSRKHDSLRRYFECCVSNHEFMNEMNSLGCGVFVVSVLLFENWDFSFNVYSYDSVLLRVYDSVKKKTCFFTKNGGRQVFAKECLNEFEA